MEYGEWTVGDNEQATLPTRVIHYMTGLAMETMNMNRNEMENRMISFIIKWLRWFIGKVERIEDKIERDERGKYAVDFVSVLGAVWAPKYTEKAMNSVLCVLVCSRSCFMPLEMTWKEVRLVNDHGMAIVHRSRKYCCSMQCRLDAIVVAFRWEFIKIQRHRHNDYDDSRRNSASTLCMVNVLRLRAIFRCVVLMFWA